jgi:hypothetical protein
MKTHVLAPAFDWWQDREQDVRRKHKSLPTNSRRVHLVASCSAGQRYERHPVDGLDLRDTVAHDIYRIATRFQIGDGGLQKEPRPFAVKRWQDDKAGMGFHLPNQFAKVACILRDDDSAVFDASRKNAMVRFATTPDMQRMDSIVTTHCV